MHASAAKLLTSSLIACPKENLALAALSCIDVWVGAENLLPACAGCVRAETEKRERAEAGTPPLGRRGMVMEPTSESGPTEA